MNKKLLNISFIFLIFALVPILFQNYTLLGSLTLKISHIFLVNVFPFLFLMMIINNTLVKINFPYYLNKIFKNPYLYIFILSALSGSPINAVLIKEFLDAEIITEKDASITLAFTTLNNPLFLYNYFMLIFKSPKIAINLFIFIYLSNIFIYLLFHKRLSHQSLSIAYNNVSLIQSVIEAIKKSINSLLMIFGIIIFFFLFTNILIKGQGILTIVLKGALEITQGLIAINASTLSIKIKELLTLVVLNFAGFSIHMQISLILNKYNINYKYFYLSRLILIFMSFFSLL